ncbi:hypothetical protein KZZ52_02035 [Dactylosporangium sp. AC04546]|uniref:hypothetical protein n=1 Tax=Dactylosporangium sp. AC04546 TaxID=2862460 RepID=UPI001EDE100E|nr:hypothetical protein [Dactylosporangium sp. AC04546]WVK84239.1 hypothetical protein KZZ52_02035 [Dactylosporangium sp. AC04546]
MSDLRQLKGRLDQISRDAQSAAGNLSGFSSRFSRQIGEVESSIGGSATGTDKDMIATLQGAEKQVAQAVAALQRVAQVASRYGASL